MSFVKDHKKSTLLLIPYIVWWIYFAYSFFLQNDSSPDHFQKNPDLLIISFALMFIYWLILLFMIFINKGERQADFLILFGLVSSPLVIALIYLLTQV